MRRMRIVRTIDVLGAYREMEHIYRLSRYAMGREAEIRLTTDSASSYWLDSNGVMRRRNASEFEFLDREWLKYSG